MAIGDDWAIDTVNKRIYHVTGTTVYTVNELYSWLMDTFDELEYMDDPVPMSAQTPTEYTMINEWFIDDESVKYLRGGAIRTSGYAGKIQVLKLSATGYTGCIAGDIGKQVMDDDVQIGALLAYDNALRKWWIRSTSTVASGSVMYIANAFESAKSYNADTATYTDETDDINSPAANDVALPPIQITTVGDAIYFGDSSKFGRVRLNVGTAGVYTGVTLQWQYWNGTSWATLSVTDGTDFFTVAGTNNITFTPPADWATTAVDGVTKYWIRCVVTALASPTLTTAPLGTQGWVGTGAGTADGASVSGEDLYANVYTLGTITTDPPAQIYIFQAGERIPEWSYLSNWDRGHIDVLIKVKEAGVEIAEAVITVFARQYRDLYDNYEIDLSAGGRNAVPIATFTDLDNLTGDYYLLYKEKSVAFTVGDVIVGETSKAYAEVVAVTDWGTTGLLTLGGVRGEFQDGENLKVDTTTKAKVNGTLGDTYCTYSAVTTQLTIGLVCTGGTSGAKRILRAIQADNSTGKYVFQVSTTATGADRKYYYRKFVAGETITDTASGSVTAGSDSITVVSGYTDVTIAFVNGTVSVGTITGTFIENERVTYTGGEAILLKAETGTLTLGNVTNTALNGKKITGDLSGAYCTASADLSVAHTMNKAFEAGAPYPYDIIVECGSIYEAGRRVSQVYEYFKFVTKDGSKFKMYTIVGTTITLLDGEEYIIAYAGYAPKKASPLATFAGGVLFGAQGLWIEGMHSDDVRNYTLIDSNGVRRDPPNKQPIRVTSLVAGDRVSVFRTTEGVIDKAMYTSHPTNNTAGKTTFEVQETLPLDTPASGVIRVVRHPEETEQRYTYTSWSDHTFSGLVPALQYTYDGNDKCYVPFIDGEATTTYIEKIVIYTTDRPVLTRVRKIGIIPFEVAGVFVSTGYIVAAIRTTDGIVTIP